MELGVAVTKNIEDVIQEEKPNAHRTRFGAKPKSSKVEGNRKRGMKKGFIRGLGIYSLSVTRYVLLFISGLGI